MGGFLRDNFYTNDACKIIMKKLVTKSLYPWTPKLPHNTLSPDTLFIHIFWKMYEYREADELNLLKYYFRFVII